MKVPSPLLNFFAYLNTVNNGAMADVYPCDHTLLKSILWAIAGLSWEGGDDTEYLKQAYIYEIDDITSAP